MIALAYQSGAKLMHISTMGFLPDGHKEVREIPVDSLILKSGYAQSKWVAEELLWQAMEKPGVDAIVVRPGSICGHSESGASNPKDALSMLLVGRALKLAPTISIPTKTSWGAAMKCQDIHCLPKVMATSLQLILVVLYW